MKFYVVTINGEVGTIAHLSDEDGKKLREYVAEKAGTLDRTYVTEQDVATTNLFAAETEVDSAIDMWRP